MEAFLGFAYWVVLLSLVSGAIGGLLIGFYYLFRGNADKRPDLFFGSLLICLALTLVHNLMIHTDQFYKFPELYFLPVYFTLAFGPLWFYFVKIKLLPQYKFRWTDAKHLMLPIGQFIYFTFWFFQPDKHEWGRQFWSPFYGGFEMLLYIGTFISYLYFGYRYLRFKRAEVRKNPNTQEGRKVAWIQRMSKVLFVLVAINATYIFVDFFSYELLGINLHLLLGFEYIGSLSFSALLIWLAFNGLVMRKV